MSTVAAQPVRPSPLGLARAQVRYAVTEYWRARLVLIFSLFIPLIWFLVIGALAGNEVLEGTGGLRVMQFAAPVAISMGALYAALPTTATSLAHARETGVLKRLRGAPSPMWVYLLGRAVGASLFAFLSVLVVLVVAVVVHDVRVVGSTLGATVLTLALAVVCYVMVGLAIAALVPSAGTAQSLSIGAVVVLSFASGLFTGIGAPLPETVTRVAQLFPVKGVTDSLQDQFNPFLSGVGVDWSTVAVLAAWSAAAAVVARWGLGDERDGPGRARQPRHPRDLMPRTAPAPATRPVTATSTAAGRPGVAAMVGGQAVTGLRLTWRDPGAVFFAVLMPVGLYAFLSTVVPATTMPSGVPVSTHNAASMVAWGVGVTAFLNLPESVVQARDRGVLKRLHGTPLSPGHLIAGRVATALAVGVVLATFVLTVGVIALDLTLTPGGVLVALVVLLLGTLSLAALGFLLAAVVPSARAFGAVALVALLSLAFVSDVLVTGAPDWMSALGSLLPLKHLQQALVAALDPAGASVSWSALTVLLGWLVGAGVLAMRAFRWQVRDQ